MRGAKLRFHPGMMDMGRRGYRLKADGRESKEFFLEGQTKIECVFVRFLFFGRGFLLWYAVVRYRKLHRSHGIDYRCNILCVLSLEYCIL